MIAMLLAAGRGERLRPITDRMPKPFKKSLHQTGHPNMQSQTIARQSGWETGDKEDGILVSRLIG